MLVIDVDLNTLKSRTMKDGVAFFYTETTKAFIFIVPRSDCVFRCIVGKSTPEKDDSFRLSELFNNNCFYVKNFVIDGRPMVPRVSPEEKPTSGSVDLENKVFVDGDE